MINLLRTNSKNPDFVNLVKSLDAELAIRDGDEHEFYDQFNAIDTLKYAVVAYQKNVPISCGAIKEIDSETIEIKRMYTVPEHRGKGIASQVLHELENWTRDLAFKRCILETGKKQPEAIALYNKSGYERIPNYGPYVGVENSLCFQKVVV